MAAPTQNQPTQNRGGYTVYNPAPIPDFTNPNWWMDSDLQQYLGAPKSNVQVPYAPGQNPVGSPAWGGVPYAPGMGGNTYNVAAQPSPYSMKWGDMGAWGKMGVVGQGIGAATDLANLYLGYKTFQENKRNNQLSREVTRGNYNNNVLFANAATNDRYSGLANYALANNQTIQSRDQYMKDRTVQPLPAGV